MKETELRLLNPDVDDFGEIDLNDSKLKYVISKIKGKKVLDIGCVQHNPENYRSRYWLHGAISEYSSSCVGLDLSSKGVDYLLSEGYNVIHGDATGFELGMKFDSIVAGDIIEHLDDHAGFFASCKQHLDVGGTLIVTTPNPWFWKNILLAIYTGGDPWVNLEHTCWFSPKTLATLAKRHGFEVVDVHYGSRYKSDRYLPLPKGLKHTTFFAELKAL